MSQAFVFPGQGAQAVGMGQALAGAFPAAKHLFQELDDALNQHLTRIMFEGPESDLTLTENAQPALMAVSLAVVRVLEKEGGVSVADDVAFVAGHSLGEYSALTAARTFDFPTAARLLKTRGQAMQTAVPVGEGAMAALLGVEIDLVEEIVAAAAKYGECAIGNDNAPGQVVVSGAVTAVEKAVEIAKDKGARRAIMLDVSAPFHCALLTPAAEAMDEALSETSLNNPVSPLVANVTAEATSDPEEIRRLLVEQVTARVRWRECVHFMKDNGVERVVELGAGNVLTGLGRRIDKELEGVALQTPEDIEAFLTA
jgi:[acyl-carrier-protein] S-malonyltransferase